MEVRNLNNFVEFSIEKVLQVLSVYEFVCNGEGTITIMCPFNCREANPCLVAFSHVRTGNLDLFNPIGSWRYVNDGIYLRIYR
jgi:hypothetical protein